MVLTKSELIASLQNEVRILVHLAGETPDERGREGGDADDEERVRREEGKNVRERPRAGRERSGARPVERRVEVHRNAFGHRQPALEGRSALTVQKLTPAGNRLQRPAAHQAHVQFAT